MTNKFPQRSPARGATLVSQAYSKIVNVAVVVVVVDVVVVGVVIVGVNVVVVVVVVGVNVDIIVVVVVVSCVVGVFNQDTISSFSDERNFH